MPQISMAMNAVDGDNIIYADNVLSGITVSGAAIDTLAANPVAPTVTVSLNGKRYTATVQADGSWSVNVEALDVAALVDGRSYLATATIADTLGNTASASEKVTVDEAASLTIRPIDTTGYINGENASDGVTISGTSAAALGVVDFAGQTVTVTLNGHRYTSVIGTYGTWSVTVGAADLAALTDGKTYTVTASATDEAGNTATATTSVTVDETASLSETAIDGDNVIDAAKAAAGITISGGSSDTILADLVGQTVTVSLNGKLYTTKVQAGGYWSLNVGPADLAALVDGRSYLATASVLDAAANKVTASQKVTVDEAASLTIRPIDTTGYISGKNVATGIAIGGMGTGALGVVDVAGQTVTVTLNGHSYTGVIGTYGTWSVTVGAADLAALTDGQTYTVTASATDEAGNAATATTSVTVDTTAPLVTETLAADTGSSSTDKISANDALRGAGDADAVVHFAVDGKAITATATADASGAWTFMPSGLSDGVHKIVASEADAAGNTDSTSLTFTLDTTAPVVTIASAGGTTNQSTETIAGTVDLADIGAIVTVYDGATVVGTATVKSNGAWSASVALTAGVNVLSAEVTDLAGNTGVSNSVTYDEQTYTIRWARAVDGDWSVPANWNTNLLPGTADSVLIGFPVDVTFSTGDTTISQLTTVASSTLSVIGGTLTVTGRRAWTTCFRSAAATSHSQVTRLSPLWRNRAARSRGRAR